ncbi:MAG: energy transducer TonB [Bacteroidales bacterium]|nr:MAG: energy transducer TonB [Bacteroidales bacterium]
MFGISNKVQGLIGTVLVHTIAIALLLLISLSASLPELENEGLLINFGNSQDGFGSTEPMVNYDNAVTISLPSETRTHKAEDKKILTQDFDEDAPTVEVKKKTTTKDTKKKATTTKEVTKTKKTSQTTKEVQEKKDNQQATTEVKQPVVNKKALFPGKATEGGTAGEGVTGKDGNQGSLEGSPDSQNRIGGATGGNGEGEGDGKGKGIPYNLGGRKSLSLPKPDYLKQKQGIVVVQVTVDRQGKVTKAVPGAKGTTTLDEDLHKAAVKAALTAKFDVSPNAPAYQTGTITYVFKYQ